LQAIAGSSAPVQHLVYSDGLASVSVFIEPRNAQTQTMRGLAKVGGAFAYSRDVDGQQIVVVGEVPAATVQAIGSGVTKEGETPVVPSLSQDAGAPPNR
jgi:sigma-E factor negative regulatory protein RseB